MIDSPHESTAVRLSGTKAPLEAGSLLGRYRLEASIGSGGMGEVYRAVDTVLGRSVAIKLLPAETFATSERRKRFEAEAKSAASVSHPNLVPVYDVGEAGGVPYIVQEFVEGETLDRVLGRDGVVPVEKAAEWGLQAAEGLAAAHDAGILHRDVKPGNLILGNDGRLRVLDFGLAKMMHPSAERPGQTQVLTNDGIVVGTVHYMSPEQTVKRPLDARSDVFSLGIVLYELASGAHPFDGESAVDVMHAVAYDPPTPIEKVAPALPAPFVAIVEKALEKRPDDRYQSIREMAVDLRRYLRKSSGHPSAMRGFSSISKTEPIAPIPAPPPAARSGSRGKVAIGLGALAALALGGLGFGLFRGRPREPRPPTATRILIQSESREEAPVFSPDGRAFAYASNERGNFDVYYRLVAGGSSVRLTDDADDEREPVFTPEGTAIYFVRGDAIARTASIWSVPTLGGPARRILDGGDQPALSKDGRHLLFRRLEGERTSLWLADANGASPKKLLDGGAGELKGARFSPDGKNIAFFWTEAYPGALGDVWRMPVAGGTPVRMTSDRRDVWGHVDFLPDGAEVLYSAVRTGIENIWMVPWKGGTPRPVAAGSFSVISPSVSPDGRSILVQSQRLTSDAWEYDLSDGKSRPLTRAGTVWAPFRLSDGRLVYGDWARQEEEVDLFLEGASGARTYLAGGSNPRPTVDGRTILFSTALGEGRRGIASVDVEGGPARRLTETPNVDEYPDPTPDGAHVVFCRTVRGGKPSVELLEIGKSGTTTLFSGDAMSTRAAEKDAVFRSCPPAGGCGVYRVPLAGGPARLVIPDGRWPALSRDRRTVYAVVGPKAHPALMKAPLDGSGPPVHVLDFDSPHDPSFWAIFTIDVADDAGKVVATRQRVDDDIALFEGVFR